MRLDWWLSSTSGTNRLRVSLSGDGGANWTSTKTDSNETTSQHSVILGGDDDTWGRTWSAEDFSNGNFQVRVHSRSTESWVDFYLDWVPVRVTLGCEAGGPLPWEEATTPGLIECSQLLQAGQFEGNPQTVFEHWNAGGVGAFQRTGYMQYEGAFSMRLHDSLSNYPDCASYDPWLYQTVQIPTDVSTMTRITVEGQRVVGASLAPCSNLNSTDFDDEFYVELQDGVNDPYFRLHPTSGDEPEDPSTTPVPYTPTPTSTLLPPPTFTPTPTLTSTPTPMPTATALPTPTPPPSCDAYSDNFDDNSLDSRWQSVDINSTGGTPLGNTSETGQRLVVSSDGSTIWDNDDCRFAYQSVPDDFDATVRIITSPNARENSKSGLMVRAGLNSNANRVMVMYTRDNGLQFAYRSNGSNSSFHDGITVGNLPVWVGLRREGDTYYASYSTDGTTWIQVDSVDVALGDTTYLGLAVASYQDNNEQSAEFDDLQVCEVLPPAPPSPPPSPPQPRPECTLVDFRNYTISSYAGQDNNPINVTAQYEGAVLYMLGNTWKKINFPVTLESGTYLEFDFMSTAQGEIHGIGFDDDDSYNQNRTFQVYGTQNDWGIDYQDYATDAPDWKHYQIPVDDHYTGEMSNMFFINDHDTSNPTAESYFANVNVCGEVPTPTPTPGPSPTPTPEPPPEIWQHFSADFTDGVDLVALAGQEVEIRFYATQDEDGDGTWFYLDDLECNVCTQWPIPDPEPGTASIGGLVRTLVSGVPQLQPGIQVAAYSQGGDVYRTISIHDGTYHFYNVPPGVYTIYAEAWVSGQLQMASATVTVVTDERNYGVDLLLQ